MKQLLTIIVGCLLLSSPVTAQIDQDSLKAFVEKTVRHYVETWDAGVALGVIYEENGKPVRRTYTFGRTRKDANGVVPNDSTIFHMGSVTKTFTALCLAKMIQPGKSMRLSDPVNQHLLLDSMRAPSFNDGSGEVPITLLDLATHTSGFPRVDPVGADKKTLTYPEMYSYVNSFVLPGAPGTCYEYSNLGVSVLGSALTHTIGGDVESMLVREVIEPLGLQHTRITLTTAEDSMRAYPYSGTNTVHETFSKSTWPAFYAAGGLYTTLSDFMTYLDFMMGVDAHGMQPALDSVTIMRRVNNDSCANAASKDSVGLVWQSTAISPAQPDFQMTWKDGAVPGSVSYICFAKHPVTGRKTGVAVLANNSTSVAFVGHQLMAYLNSIGLTDVNSTDEDIPIDPPRVDVFPNPASSAVRFSTNIDRRCTFSLQIVDGQGAVVYSTLPEFVDPGVQTIEWNSSRVPSGAYLVIMNIGDHIKQARFSVIR